MECEKFMVAITWHGFSAIWRSTPYYYPATTANIVTDTTGTTAIRSGTPTATVPILKSGDEQTRSST